MLRERCGPPIPGILRSVRPIAQRACRGPDAQPGVAPIGNQSLGPIMLPV
jgi:hypothetical protein